MRRRKCLYLKHFQNVVDVVEHCGGSIGYHTGLRDFVLTETGKSSLMPEVEKERLKKDVQERYLAFVIFTWCR
jgi:hypothetical protein